jgi:hypothetical protein
MPTAPGVPSPDADFTVSMIKGRTVAVDVIHASWVRANVVVKGENPIRRRPCQSKA